MAGMVTTIGVSQPVYDKLRALRSQLAESLGRSVTFSEVLEQLLEKKGEQEP